MNQPELFDSSNLVVKPYEMVYSDDPGAPDELVGWFATYLEAEKFAYKHFNVLAGDLVNSDQYDEPVMGMLYCDYQGGPIIEITRRKL